MASVKQGLRTVLYCAAFLALLIASFTGLTLLHGRIDPALTHDNMVKSLEILDEEGQYPNIGIIIGHPDFTGFEGQGNKIDNFTNMWMVQSADSKHQYDSGEFDKGLPYDESRREPIPGDENAQAFSSGWQNGNYWSGYRIVMKPLLLVMDVRGLRIVQLLLVLVSAVWATVRVARDIGKAEAALMLFALFAINPLNTIVDFDQAPDLIQALFSVVTVLWMLRREVQPRFFILFFMALGAIEAFVNCLIMPLVTLGFPLVAFFLAQAKHGAKVRKQIAKGLKLCISWCVGYAGSFFSVWIISASFKDMSRLEAIHEGLSQFFRRAGGTESSLGKSLFLSIQNNINLNVSIIWVLLIAVVALLIAVKLKKRFHAVHPACPPLVAASLLPFIWIVVLNNHSYIHSCMAHDIFAIALWGLSCCAYYLLLQYKDIGDHERV